MQNWHSETLRNFFDIIRRASLVRQDSTLDFEDKVMVMMKYLHDENRGQRGSG